MKTWRVIALLAILCLAIVASLYFKKSAEADKAWMDYQREKGIRVTQELLYVQERKQHDEAMAELQGMIDSSVTIIAELEGTVVGKEADIERLEQLRPLLSDKDDIIANQDEQIVSYKGVVFTLKEKDVERGKIILNLTEQVHASGRMLLKSEGETLAEKSLRLSAERGWNLERARTQTFRKRERLTRSVVVGSFSAAMVGQAKGGTPLVSLAVGATVSLVTYLIWK